MHFNALTLSLASCLLATVAILSLLKAQLVSKALLIMSLGLNFLAVRLMGTNALSFYLTSAALGCGLIGAWNLFVRPKRWIHRFVIYTGYAATASAMSAGILHLSRLPRPVTMWEFWGLVIGIYAIGSAAIFISKTFIVRHSAKTFPDYNAGEAPREVIRQ